MTMNNQHCELQTDMRISPSRDKLQENHGINGYISSSCSTDDSPESTECDKVRSPSRRTEEYTCDEESAVKCGLTTDQVARETPE